jgi:hypothetical protein
MLFKEIYEAAGIRTSSHSGRRTFATRLNASMIGLWAIFTIMLFVVEPLFLHAWFDARAQRDPDGAFRVASRGHRILSLLAVVTVLGAVGGTHGLF